MNWYEQNAIPSGRTVQEQIQTIHDGCGMPKNRISFRVSMAPGEKSPRMKPNEYQLMWSRIG